MAGLGAFSLYDSRWSLDSASENGWVGRSKPSLRRWVRDPDIYEPIEGFDESWVHPGIAIDDFIVTAVKYGDDERVIASDLYHVNDDVPGNRIVELYRPE